MKNKKDSLLLKWGTLKGWDMNSEKGKKLLEEYLSIGSSISAMTQQDTPRQKELILEMIDVCEEVRNDWSGEDYSNDKELAKRYILEYGIK